MTFGKISLQGVGMAVSANGLFAIGSLFVALLHPLSGTDIFAWRILWTLPFALLFLVSQGKLPALQALFADLKDHPSKALALTGCAGMLGIQQWLFMWAPLHGKLLDVSLGYFILPIVMVFVGWLVDGHRVHKLQWLAITFGMLGVGHEFLMHGTLSWPLLLAAIGLVPYFLLRRKLTHDSLVVFSAEILLMQPIALAFASSSGSFRTVAENMQLLKFPLPGLGILSALSFGVYLKASRMLPMGLFGLLGYVEPVLLVVISVAVFRESFPYSEWWTYLFILLSIMTTATYVTRVTSMVRA